MKQTFIITILLLLTLIKAGAQVCVTGEVNNNETGEPIAGASVIIKGEDGKIKKFATTNSSGTFNIKINNVNDCLLEVSMISFNKFSTPLSNATFPLKINLDPGSIHLKEVAVKADRIREQGDTVIYNVDLFAQNQDRSISDVLKRMPGIEVANSGQIKYQGEDINKFYIEGIDLLGGKYGVATNGIRYDDVGAVEVMENHQPLQVLSGISLSDKAAINLRLKNKTKATWTFHGSAGGGYSWKPEGAIWNGEIFAMAVMPNFQNITTLRTNNTGNSLSDSSTDFFAGIRYSGIKPYINIAMPSFPGLSLNRTLNNRSILISTNNMWKTSAGEIKVNIDYTFNRINTGAESTTTHFVDTGNTIISENRSGKEKKHSLNGKFIFEKNERTTFINNTLQTNIDWNDSRLTTIGTIPNNQTLHMPDYYISNKFSMIKRFNGNHLITFNSDNEWESIPQNLEIRNNKNNHHSFQSISDHAFYTHESVAYTFVIKSVSIGLEGGIKARFKTMKSNLSGIDLIQLDGIKLHNIVNTTDVNVYATPKLEYQLRRVNFKLSLPLSYSNYTFNNSIANHNEVYLSPSLKLTWKPGNRFSSSIRGSLGRTPINLGTIHPGVIMTDYRTLHTGLTNFYNISAKQLSANISYKHPLYGFFANSIVMHSWNHTPYTISQFINGDYIMYGYTDADNTNKTLLTLASLGKTLDFMRGSCNINGSYTCNKTHLLSQGKTVDSATSTWSIKAGINGNPIYEFLTFDYRIGFSNSCLAMNNSNRSWLSSLTNELEITITPTHKWQLQVTGEHYHNEITENQYKNLFMIDSKISFFPLKRIELSVGIHNILNHQNYSYTTYTQLSKFESNRHLRGRELLFTITLRK